MPPPRPRLEAWAGVDRSVPFLDEHLPQPCRRPLSQYHALITSPPVAHTKTSAEPAPMTRGDLGVARSNASSAGIRC